MKIFISCLHHISCKLNLVGLTVTYFCMSIILNNGDDNKDQRVNFFMLVQLVDLVIYYDDECSGFTILFCCEEI